MGPLVASVAVVTRLGLALVVTGCLLAGCASLEHGPPQREIEQVIQQNAPYLSDANGQPKFHTTKVVEPLAGWYVVTIQMGGGEPNKVVLRQTGGPDSPLTFVVGPGTSFPPEYVTLPDAVRSAL